MQIPRAVSRIAKGVGAVLIVGYTLLLTAIGVIGSAETVVSRLPPWLFQPVPMLSFIVLGLLAIRLGSAPPGGDAAIRASFAQREGSAHIHLALSNIGDHEATQITMDKLTFEGYPWAAEFYDVGSVPGKTASYFVHEAIRRTPSPGSCTDRECLWWVRGRSLNDFCEGATLHRIYHVHRELHDPPLDAEQWQRLKERFKAGEAMPLQSTMVVRFADETTDERWASHHALNFEITVGGLRLARCVFQRVTREPRQPRQT